jgi:hypothetical protein
MKIRGTITVNTPGSDWTEGDPNKSITFTPYGNDLSTVYVFLYDPDDAAEHRLDTAGVAITVQDGNPQTWGPATFTVPDAKSLTCTLRVRDNVSPPPTATVEGESGTFACYPVISSVAITPTVSDAWIADATNQEVTWSFNGSTQVEYVDIFYSSTGIGGFDYVTPNVVNAFDTSGGTIESYGLYTVPNAKTLQGRIAVRDDDTDFDDLVNDMTPSDFRICGMVYKDTSFPASGEAWDIGETDKLIKWTYDGNISTVDIDVNYGLGAGWESLDTIIPVGDGAAGYDPDLAASWTAGVPDQVSNSVQFRIKDTDGNYNDITTVDTETFAITATFSFANPPGAGMTYHIDSLDPQFEIRWNTFGAEVDFVKLEYWNKDSGASGEWLQIKSGVANTKWGSGTVNENKYTWDTGVGHDNALPTNLNATDLQFRVTATDPDQPDTTTPSSVVVICGDITVSNTAPAQGVEWVADGTTANTITWDVYGTVPLVKITYSRDSKGTWEELVASMAADTNTGVGGDTSGDNVGVYQWTIPINPEPSAGKGDYITEVDLGDLSYVRVEDASSFGTYVRHDSNNFIVKGELLITAPTAVELSNGLDCDTAYTVTCERHGRVREVNLKYSTDGGTSYNSWTQSTGLAFSPVASGTTVSAPIDWTVPETPVNNTYVLMAEDANYTWANGGTFGETADFRVLGAIDLTAPEAIGTWRITETKPFTWDITHGEIPKVKGTFSAFNELADPVGSGSYDWTLPETTTLNDTVTFRVVQDDANFEDDVQSDDSAVMKIRGTITVNTPGSDWKEGETDKSITFTPYGNDLSTVYVFLYDPDDAAEHRLDTAGVAITVQDGNPQTWGPATFTVPDAKSLTCTIRVRDNVSPPPTATVEGESGTFACYPVISGVDITPSVGEEAQDHTIWRAGLLNQQVTWSVNGSAQVDAVDIVYSPTGAFAGEEVTIRTGATTSESCSDITAPTANLSYQAAEIRVQENDPDFDDKVYDDSTETFSVLGRIAIDNDNPGTGDDWFVGDLTREVRWTAYGVQLTSVKIYIDYGSGYIWQKTEDTVPGSADSWVYDDENTGVDGVGDYVTENATIMIEDADAQRGAYTQYISNTFNITGDFTNIQVTADDPEDTVVVADRAATIASTKAGALITDVVMEYTDGSNWYNIANDVQDDTTTTVTYSANYGWTPPDTLMVDNLCQIRITDPDNSAATGISSTFTVAPKTKVALPDSGSSWNALDDETITWQKWGDFATVNIYYRPDDQSSWVLLNISGPVASNNGDGLNGSWLWEDISDGILGPQITLSPTAEIRVLDASRPTYTHAIESEPFETKGSLTVDWPNGTDHAVYECGVSSDIRWSRYGNIEGVEVYLWDGDSWELQTDLGTNGVVDFVGAEAYHTESWTPPEIVSIAYKIKVVDKNNVGIEDESVPFNAKGKLKITQPDVVEQVWYITDTAKQIRWDVDHGNISDVKIEVSPGGLFDGDEYTIIASTQADNETLFDAGTTPVATGYYDWDILRNTPLSEAAKFRVKDDDEVNFDDVASESTATHRIRGKITVDTPGSDWNVGSTTDSITWNAYGDIPTVWIDVYNGSTWLTSINGAGGTACGDGDGKSWSVANWDVSSMVPDMKADDCQIRIKDAESSPIISEVSGTFYVYPTISGVTITSSAGEGSPTPPIWRAGLGGQEVTWTENDLVTPTLISEVEVLYDQANDGTFETTLTIGDGTVHEICNSVTAPLALSYADAVVRVRDIDALFQDKIYDDSSPFRVLGRVAYGASPAQDDDWFIGDTARQVIWTVYGNEVTQLDVYVDYGSGFNYVTTLAYDASPWTFEDPVGSGTVGDHITESAQIRLEDNDVNRGPLSQFDSPTFHIAGDFTGITVTADDPEDTVVVADRDATITSTKIGALITNVVMEYTDGTNWYNVANDVQDDTTTTVLYQADYGWTPPETLMANNLCRIRITDEDNPASTGTSATFTIAPKTKVSLPNSSSSWDANTTETITWQKWGDFPEVNIYYRPDDQTAWLKINEGGPVASHGGDGLNGSWNWVDIGSSPSITLSPTAEIRVLDASREAYTHAILSEQFTTKGSLEMIWPNATTYSVYECGKARDIQWRRYGNIIGVEVYYDPDNTSDSFVLDTSLGVSGVVDFGGSDFMTVSWTPPEIVGKTYRIRIIDTGNPAITADSVPFQVKGELQIIMPDAQQPEWSITETKAITWDIVHGNIANVKIIGDRDGDFITTTGDQFTIVNQTPAGPESYDWDILEKSPSIIGDQVKIRIMDADTDYDVKTDSSATFTIKGTITSVSSPASGVTWNVADGGPDAGDGAARTVAWNCAGEVTSVNILFAENGVDFHQVAAGVASAAGPNTWTTDNWSGANGVEDAMADTCVIKVVDAAFGNEEPSAAFKVYPIINVTTPAQDALLRAESTGNLVEWDDHDSNKVQTVDIYLDFSAGGGGYPSNPITGWTTVGSCNTVVLPSDLSEVAVFKVQDATNSEVSGVSNTFYIHGSLDPADGTGASGVTTPLSDWVIGGQGDISFGYTGDISQVDIYVDYQDGQGWTQEADNLAVSGGSGSLQLDPIPNKSTNAAQIKVEDADTNRSGDTYHTSNPFNIVGTFTIQRPATGETITYGEPFDIEWIPSGSTVTHVDIYYDVDAGGWNKINTVPVANTGNPATYSWTMTDMVSSANARIKIESSDPTKPATPAISGGTGQQGLFAIHGDITYGNSPGSGDQWVVGETGKSIPYTLDGKVDYLDIVYSKDNGGDGFAYTISAGVDTTMYPTGITWDIPTDQDILSNSQGLIRVMDANYSTVYDDSPLFTIKGVLSGFNITFPGDVATFPDVLRVEEAETITWSRTGTTMGDVNIRYSTDRGVSWSAGNILHTMASADGGTGWAWSVDANILRDNAVDAGLVVRVESVDDDRVYCQSGILSVMGRIQINDPYQQEHVYVVGSTTETISWTPTGTFSTVKIEYNTAYDFTGEGDTITSSATNSASGIMGSADWPQVPNFIRDTIFMRVSDAANPDLTYSRTDSSKPCKIRGSIDSVSKPILDEEWNVGDLDKIVQWTTNGDMANLEIAFTYDAVDAESGSYTTIATVTGDDGTYTWQTDNWDVGSAYNGGVADVKSDQCYIRVMHPTDTDVPPAYSVRFTIKPLITVNPIPTWVAETQSSQVTFNGTLEVHEVTWNITGDQVSSVRIELSYDGGGSYTFELDNGVSVPANSGMPYELTAVTLPTTLVQNNAKVRVSDADYYLTDPDFIAGESTPFSIIGGLVLGQPATGVDWKSGEVKQVQWTPYGNMTGNVNVYYKYDGGAYPPTEDASDAASGGTCDWTVPDHVSENVQVKIVDSLNSATWAESGVFNIMARFSDLQPDNDDATIHDNDIIYAELQTNITWDNHNITSVTDVTMEYYTPENGVWNLIVDDDDPGTPGVQNLDDLVANTGSCPWTPLASDVTDGGILRITDPDNANSEVEGTGTFFIRPSITVTGPVDPGTGIIVGSIETISWTYKGDFGGVGFYYSSTGTDGPWTLIDEGVTIYPYGPDDGDGDGGNKAGSYDWTIPVSTPLSTDFYIKVAKDDEPTVVYGLTSQIVMRGTLTIERPKPSIVPADGIQRVYGGDTPAYCFIDWIVVGDAMSSVKVQYTVDDVAWRDITTIDPSTATSYNWPIPGDVVDIIGTGRNIKVSDTSIAQMDQYTYDISENFEIKGEITLDYPSQTGGDTFVVGVSENIQWTPYGNFPGNQVLLYGSTDNFVTDFKIAVRPAGVHGVPQTYPWNVIDVIEGTLPISTSVKIRVEDYNDASGLVEDTSGVMTIKGALTLDTPSQIWYVDDTNRTITWDYDGPVVLVDIYVRNSADTAWVPLTDVAGYDCTLKQFSAFTVPDEISNTSKLRIKDHDDPTGTVEDISGNFIIRGKITFDTTRPSQDQVFIVGAEQVGEDNTIAWSNNGTIPFVEIRYDVGSIPTFTPTFPVEKTIETGWPGDTPFRWGVDNTSPPIEVPDDMGWIYFKVMDERDPTNVYATSNRAIIGGSITITNLTDYNNPVKVGDNFNVNWTKTGAGLQEVDISYCINGDDADPANWVFAYALPNGDNRGSTNSPLPWTPLPSDALSPNCRIKVVDSDNPGTYDVSPLFQLEANWQWNEASGDGDPDGNVWVVGVEYVFEWNTNGNVPNIRIDYDVDGDDSWEDPPLETSITNVGGYTWEIPDQPNILSETVKIKISDTRDPNSILESGLFKIRGYIEVTDPESTDEWDVDSGQTIYWDKRGPVTDCNVYWKATDLGSAHDEYTDTGHKINTLAIPAVDGATVGCPWTIPDAISTNVQVKVVTSDPMEYDESDLFTIQGAIEIDQHPVGTDEWVPGDTETISWIKHGTIPVVRIQYSPTGLEVDYATIPGGDAAPGNSLGWQVLDNIGITNRIKIFNPDGAKPTKQVISEAFRIKGRLAITSPGINDTVPVNLVGDGDGLKYPIQWTVDGTVSKVELQYSYDGNPFSTLPGTEGPTYYDAETSPGSGVGEYLWLVPNTISDTVLLRVINRDSGESDVDDDSENFYIAGRLDLTQPDGGVGIYYEIDNPLPILWTMRGSVGDVALRYSTNGGLSYDYAIHDPIAEPVAATAQSYSWTIPDAVSDSVKVEIQDADGATHTVGDESQENFEIRTTIDMLRPTGTDTVWLVGSQELIQWRCHGTIATVKIEFSINGVVDPDPVISTIAGDTADYSGTGEPDGLGQYLWTLPDDSVGNNNVRVHITNLGDNDVVAESEPFTARGGFQFVEANGDEPLSGDRWAVNANKIIKWTTFGSIPKVNIYYTTDGTDVDTATWIPITTNPLGDDNVEQKSWTVPTTIDSDLMKVKVEDFNDPLAVGYSEFFTVHDILYLDRPNGTSDPQDARILKVGVTEKIEWHSEGTAAGVIKIEYATDGVPTWIDPPIQSSIGKDVGEFDWQIPPTLSDTVRVRIVDVNDGQVEAISANDCFIKPRFTFTDPNATTTWYSQDEVDIIWATDGPVTDVEIYYSTDNGDNWSQCLDQVNDADDGIETWPYDNDGLFEWKVPNLVKSDLGLIKIVSSVDPNGLDVSDNFAIRGKLIMLYPDDGTQTFRAGTSELLQWETRGIIPSIGLQYYDGGGWVNILNDNPPGLAFTNINSENWTVPTTFKTEAALIRVYDITDSNVEGISQNPFKIKPRIIFTNAGGETDEPIGGEVYYYGATTHQIQWTSYGPVSTVDIYYSKDDLEGDGPWLGPLTTSEPNIDVFPWTIPQAVSGDCYVRVADSSEPTVTEGISGKFRIRTLIDLIAPDTSDPLYVDDPYDIEWTQDGDTDEIKIYYYDVGAPGVTYGVDGGTGIVTNPDPVAGVRTYPWTIPDFIKDNVKVVVEDPNNSNAMDESAVTFPIRPKFTILHPTTGDKWDIGTQQTIEWNWTGTVYDAQITYTLNAVDYVFIANIPDMESDPDQLMTYDWLPDPNHPTDPVTPSPDFYVKISDIRDAVNRFNISLQAKVMADFTIDPPPLSDYKVEDNYTITWSCVGAVANVALHYSTDSGVSFPDPANRITDSTPNDGATGYDWQIPDDISRTVRVRVKSSIDDDALDMSSADFRIMGDIWAKAPVFDEYLDIGQSYPITWGWKGTIPEVKITYSIDGLTGPFNPILENYDIADDGIVANGAGPGGDLAEHSYTWTVPDEATASAIIRVADTRDGVGELGEDVIGESGEFHISCYLIVNAPVSTDRLSVDSPFDVKWEWGGTMPEVKITYSEDGLGGSFVPILETWDIANDGIVENAAGIGGPGSEHSFTWTTPDAISTNCVVIVADPRDETINDDSEPFKIQGAFTLIAPAVAQNAGGEYECRWITNEIRKVEWTTFGTIDTVDIVYSDDDFQTEIPIEDSGGTPATDVANIDQFDWKVPDDCDPGGDGIPGTGDDQPRLVKIRVYDHDDHEVYVTGPVPDGVPLVDEMKIDYYTITWDIRNIVTNMPIMGLSVTCTSGWNAAGVSSPIIKRMPAGFWSTTFTHGEYGPISHTYILGWDETAGTWNGDDYIFRTMETIVVHIWRAYSEYSYNPDLDVLAMTSWLERDGALVTGGEIIDVLVYDDMDIIKRKTIIQHPGDELITGDETFYYYNDIPIDYNVWSGERWVDNGTPNDPSDDYLMTQTIWDTLTLCAPFKIDEMPVPANFGGFFKQYWGETPDGDTTAYHTDSDGVDHDSLESGIVYTTITEITLPTAAHFKTPQSFEVTSSKKLYEMDETVKANIDSPLSVFTDNMTQMMEDQSTMIVEQVTAQTVLMEAQTQMLEDATDAITLLVDEAMVGFEEAVSGSLLLLTSSAATAKASAAVAKEAAALLETTALRHSWQSNVSPDPALSGDEITLRLQGPPDFEPKLTIYSWNDDEIIDGETLKESVTQEGLYTYEFTADTRFDAGKAYVYTITIPMEDGGDSLVSGSGVVEAMSITTIAGLAASAPEAARAAKKALEAIKTVEATLISDEDINIALTLSNLKDSVNDLPNIMARDEGSTRILSKTVNDIAKRLQNLAGEEGYDLGTILETALEDSATIEDISDKTDEVGQSIDVMQEVFEHKLGGLEDPFIVDQIE